MKKWVVLFLLFAFLGAYAQTQPLTITNILVSPRNPQSGEDVIITVTLVNRDFKGDFTVTMKFLVDDGLKDVKVATSEARSAITFSFFWKAEEGKHTLTIYYTYFSPLESYGREDLEMVVGTLIKEDFMEQGIVLFNAGKYGEALEKFNLARQTFENENNNQGVEEVTKWANLCNESVIAENLLLQAEDNLKAGNREDARNYFMQARTAYESMGDAEKRAYIDGRLKELEEKKTSFLEDKQLLLYTGIIVILIIVVFIYAKSREGAGQKTSRSNFSRVKSTKAPREDRLQYFDEGEKGAPFLALCRRILETEVRDRQDFLKLSEEFRRLKEEFGKISGEEASSVKKSFEMCLQKVEDEEKKWTSIKELENLISRCDSFLAKYSNKSYLEKNMVDAYNLYVSMQEKLEELRGHDPELERRTEEALKKCYHLIEDEVHEMRE